MSSPNPTELVSHAERTSSRPRQVTLAIRVMWALWGVAVLYLVVVYIIAMNTEGVDFGVLLPLGIVQLLVMCLEALLIRMVSKRRNWARLLYMWLMGAFSALVLAGVVVGLANPTESDWNVWQTMNLARGLVIPLVNAYIIWLLLLPASRAWFRRQGP